MPLEQVLQVWLQDDSELSCDDVLDEIESEIVAITSSANLHITLQGAAAGERNGSASAGTIAIPLNLLHFFLSL